MTSAVNHPLWFVWRSMKTRCNNSNRRDFRHYGGRGVRVCERWMDFGLFVQDVSPRPSPKHSLDRWPNKDGNYEPGNWRWATRTEQLRNQRRNHLITHEGETRCLSEWAEVMGINKHALTKRIKAGWPIDKALTAPVRAKTPSTNQQTERLR